LPTAGACSSPTRRPPGFSGRDSFTYTVKDRDGQAITQTVRVTVTPDAQDDAAQTPFETSVTIDVLANDHGSLDPASVALVSGPAHGGVSFDPATGSARYMPVAGFTGDDSFVYRVLDRDRQPATATVRIRVGPAPLPPPPPPAASDLVVTKSADRRTAVVGDEVTYRLVVENRGDGAAEDVVLVDSPLLRVDLDSVSLSQGNCQRGTPNICHLGTIEPGERVTITAVIVPRSPGTLVNGVAVTAPTEDDRRLNNVEGAIVRVRRIDASVGVSKRANVRRVRSGRPIRFDVNVRSRGPQAARSVLVCDTLPRGLTLVRAPEARTLGRHICWRAASATPGERLRYQVLARARPLEHAREASNTVVVRGLNLRTRRASARFVIAADPRLGACAARRPIARASC
jgi:uncharacterized repeat protein (TIGR01451 family)